MNYKGLVLNILTALFQIIGIPASVLAAESIELNGRIFHLTSNTVLLDREGLTGCQDAVADPVEAFERINVLCSDAVLLVAP